MKKAVKVGLLTFLGCIFFSIQFSLNASMFEEEAGMFARDAENILHPSEGGSFLNSESEVAEKNIGNESEQLFNNQRLEPSGQTFESPNMQTPIDVRDPNNFISDKVFSGTPEDLMLPQELPRTPDEEPAQPATKPKDVQKVPTETEAMPEKEAAQDVQKNPTKAKEESAKTTEETTGQKSEKQSEQKSFKETAIELGDINIKIKESDAAIKSVEKDYKAAQSELANVKNTIKRFSDIEEVKLTEKQKDSLNSAKEKLKPAEEKFAKASTEYSKARETNAYLKQRKVEVKASFEAQKTTEQLKGIRESLKGTIQAREIKINNIKQQIKTINEELGFKPSETELEGYKNEKAGLSEKPKTVDEYEQQLKKENKTPSEIEERVKKFKEQEQLINEGKSELEIQKIEKQTHAFVNDQVSWKRWAINGVKGSFHFLKEQLGVAIFFMLPGEIWKGLQETEQRLAVFNTITAKQQFGGIVIKSVPGTVSESEPTGSMFLYADYPFRDLVSAGRRYFMPLDQYQKPGTEYINSGRANELLELRTGAVINGAGVIKTVYPLFTSDTAESSDYNKPLYMQDILDDTARYIGGFVRKEEFTSELGGTVAKHWVNPPGNKTVTNLFTRDKKTKISPLFKPTLDLFRAGQLLSEFNVVVQGIRPLGAINYALLNYQELFESGGSQFEFGERINSEFAKESSLDHLIKVEGNQVFSGEQVKGNVVGLGAEGDEYDSHLLAQHVYVYQSTATPVAKFMKSVIPACLKDYVGDYLVAVDFNNAIIPAMVPQINSNKDGAIVSPVIEFVENKNIVYLVSLVTGATFTPGKDLTILRNSDGSTDYTTVSNPVVAQFKKMYGSRKLLMNQVSAMRLFAQRLITEGPFPLSNGLSAHLVKDLGTKLDDDAELEKQRDLSEFGAAGQAEGVEKQKVGQINQGDRQNVLKNIYVYRIDNALSGSKGANTLPDYIIPVSINHATGNYLLVSLGSQAAVKTGEALPRVSSTVTALISLVTSKVYDSTYSLLKNSIVTDIVVMDAPGKPRPCAKEGLNCSHGYEVQNGGRNVPIATAFMESDLNPVNSARGQNDLVKVVPFHFLNLKYDYSLQASNDEVGQTDFIAINNSKSIQTLSEPLYKILPVSLTGILSAANEDGSNLAKDSGKKSVSSQEASKQAEYNFTHVHTLWRQAKLNSTNANGKWAMILAEGPHDFTANGWSIAADSGALTEDLFFYSVTSPLGTSLQGLWVAGQLSGGSSTSLSLSELPAQLRYKSGPEFASVAATFGLPSLTEESKTFGILVAQDIFKLGAIQNLGGNFVNNKNLNVLVNIATGEVLIRCIDKAVGAERVLPITNFKGQVYTINPQEVLAQFIKSTGRQSLPEGLGKRINRLQEGKTSDKIGPVAFGPFMLFIDRKDNNVGNYIYQAYRGSLSAPEVYDYVIATGLDSLNIPIDGFTQNVVSLVSSIQYTATGGENSLIDENGEPVAYADQILPLDKNKTALIGFDKQMVALINRASGAAVRDELQTALATANKSYVDKKLAEQAAQNKNSSLQDDTYEERVISALKNNTTDYKFPSLSAAVDVEGSSGVVFDSASKQFFLKEIRPEENACKAGIKEKCIAQKSAQKAINYYAFNIAKDSNKTINQVPTGLHFRVAPDGTVSPVSILSVTTARAMAEAHGITILDDGSAQSKTFTVDRLALTMMPADRDLAGGKDGKIMQLTQAAPVAKTSSGSTYFVYKNVANFSVASSYDDQKKSNVASLINPKRPSDILLQVNSSTGKVSYISLVTGFEYDMDGQPAVIKAKTYLSVDKKGSPLSSAPLLSWGKSDDDRLLLVPVRGSLEDSNSVAFGEFMADYGGVSYQYTAGGKLYNLTYVNPTTGKIDGNVYQVDVESLKIVVKSWSWKPEAASMTDPDTNEQVAFDGMQLQMSTNMAQAMSDLKQAGMIISQKMYRMFNVSGDGSVGVINAYFNMVKDEWTVYASSYSQDKQSDVELLGNFKTISNKDGSGIISSSLLTHLGVRDVQSGQQDIKPVADDGSEIDLSRSVYFINNQENSPQRGQITGVMYRNKYFALDGVGTYKNNGSAISIVEAISTSLKCTGDKAQVGPSAESACKSWITQESVLQRQNDIRFMVLVDSALNHQHVYGYEYPAEPSVNLGKLFEALNIRVVMSNQAAFTILKNIAVGSFTQLDSASIKNETMSYAEYKAEIISSIKEFYQKKIAASGPSLEKMLAEQSVQALADITSKFNSVEQMVKKLFVDSGSGTLVYKISSDDESMDFYQSGIKSGYITYPSAGNGGGFVFNDKGIPTANVVDNSDMRIIQNNLGDLKATATAPVVVLQIPSMVDSYIFHK